MKPLRNENIIVSFIETLIAKFGFTFARTKFHYICEHEFYSSLNIKNEYDENIVNITIIANDILDEVWFNINYDLRSDGTYWKSKRFQFSLENMDLIAIENFLMEIKKEAA